jgi:chromosome segregation ATPase
MSEKLNNINFDYSDKSELAMDELKRSLIASIEKERSPEVNETQSMERNNVAENKSIDSLFDSLTAKTANEPELCETINTIKTHVSKGIEAQKALRVSEDTCRMLEDSLTDFEGRILDSIAKNGKLYQRISDLEEQIMDLRVTIANVTRQREALRNRVESLLAAACKAENAVAASERELTYLKLEQESNVA